MKNKSFKGLTEAEVLKSREQYGVNILTPPEKESLWSKFLEKFEDKVIANERAVKRITGL